MTRVVPSTPSAEREYGARTAAADVPPATRLIPLAVFGVTALIFAPAIWGGFINWDDYDNFTRNLSYRGLGPHELRWMFTTAHTGHWIPLTWVTLGFDYVLWGMNPFGYHLTNVLLHAGTATLFYGVAMRLFRLAFPGVAETARAWGAAAGALFFAIHPLRVESVAWITERRDVLSGLFFMLTVLTYLAACEGRRRAQPGRLWLSVGCYGLALLSKSIVMPLPIILVLLDRYPLGRLPRRWRDWWSGEAKHVWAEKLPFLALAGAVGIAAMFALRAEDSLVLGRFTWSQRAATLMYGLAFYVRKTLVPAGLMPLYELPGQVRPLATPFVLSTLAVVGVTTALWRLRGALIGPWLAWIAYLLFVGPVSLQLHKGHQLVTDRYSYLSCLGFAVLLGAGTCLIARANEQGVVRRWVSSTATGLLVIWLVALGAQAVSQARVWHDSETLWRHAVAGDETCAICHSELGSALVERGAWEPAIEEFKTTLALRPDLGLTKLALSFALLQAGRPAEAAEHARPVVAEYPNAAEPRVRLGAALVDQGALDEGVRELTSAIRLNPRNPEALTYRGIARTSLGRPTEAIADLRRAVELLPTAALSHLGLARAYLAAGDVAAAVKELQILDGLDRRLADQLRTEALRHGRVL